MIKLHNGWTLRKRQEECHDKLIESYKKGHKEFLIAANCRFGKTITALQTLRDMAANDQVIVVISTMDIKKEWTEGAEVTGFDLDLLNQAVNDISRTFQKQEDILFIARRKNSAMALRQVWL